MKFHFLSSNNPEAKNTEKKLTELFGQNSVEDADYIIPICLLYTSPSPRDKRQSRMPSSA